MLSLWNNVVMKAHAQPVKQYSHNGSCSACETIHLHITAIAKVSLSLGVPVY